MKGSGDIANQDAESVKKTYFKNISAPVFSGTEPMSLPKNSQDHHFRQLHSRIMLWGAAAPLFPSRRDRSALRFDVTGQARAQPLSEMDSCPAVSQAALNYVESVFPADFFRFAGFLSSGRIPSITFARCVNRLFVLNSRKFLPVLASFISILT